MRSISTVLAAMVLAPVPANPKPQLGPDAVPITTDHAYLQSAPAVDYWAFSPYDKPQFTSSACSIASVTMAFNGLRGLPAKAAQKVPTQQTVRKKVGNKAWQSKSAEGGDGVTYKQLPRYTVQTMAAYGLDTTVSSCHPQRADAAALATTREILARNEASADNVALTYFDQGVLTGYWNGPHASVIGAYDAATDRVLVLDVDQEWYVPYWSPVSALLAVFVKPAPKNQGMFAGQTGGIVLVST